MLSAVYNAEHYFLSNQVSTNGEIALSEYILLIASANSPPEGSTVIFGILLFSGTAIVSSTMTSSILLSAIRSIAGPESTGCVAAAVMLLAP